MVLNLSIAWALASGAALALLGGALAFVKPRRPPALFFSAFAFLWGTQIVVANLARATEDVRFIWLSLALQPPVYLFLVHVVTIYPRRAVTRWFAALRGAFAVAAVGAAASFAFAPDLIVEQVVATPQGAFVRFGDAVPAFIITPFYAAFAFAVLRLAFVYLTGQGAERQQARFLLAGLLLFVSYANVAALWPFVASPAAVAALGAAGVVFAALFAAGIVVTTVVATALVREAPPAGPDGFLVASATVPGVVALLEIALHSGGLPRFDTLGLWRLGTVALVAFGVARYHLFDLEVRLRALSRRAVPVAAAAVAAALVLTVLGGAPTFVAAAAAVTTAVPVGVAVWRFRAAPVAEADDDFLRHRKLEVYQAALERVRATGASGAADDRLLTDLRRSLGLSDEEENAIAAAVTARAAPALGPKVVAPGVLVAERYRVDRLLGEGAHGRAFLAFDETDNVDVVLKVVGTAALGGRAVQLLAREADILRSIDHENVVKVHAFLEGQHEAVVVMEFADGGNLASFLQRRGHLGVREAVAILDQILAGLAAAHERGVVHRDLKPSNVLMTRDGVAKVADFGVARDASLASLGLTQAGVGTPLFMAPEQVRGLDVDARTDLYAAAVVFHSLLTGRFYLKVAGRDDFQVRRLIVQGDHRLDLAGHPPWVAGFLRRGLAIEPDDRFASAADMRAALQAQD